MVEKLSTCFSLKTSVDSGIYCQWNWVDSGRLVVNQRLGGHS